MITDKPFPHLPITSTENSALQHTSKYDRSAQLRMEESTKADAAAKVPTFDGDEANFPVWKMRFHAFAKLKNFKQALEKDGELDLPIREDEEIDVATDIGKKQKAAVHRNDVAMACLTMAFTSETLIGMVYKSQTLLWPSGRAHMVMSALMDQYEPKDRISKVEMRKRLNSVKLGSGRIRRRCLSS